MLRLGGQNTDCNFKTEFGQLRGCTLQPVTGGNNKAASAQTNTKNLLYMRTHIDVCTAALLAATARSM